ncbi:ABC transporter transmembrane domain-containing protein [Pseudoduganella sp. GCM10020061]|uniref:ABC transporter transmembrane domain-containing protein n=1 Tax=Pseudoduganella sp. GCM10020061 TaxID=3317345 RepID=UPI0036371A7C
MTLSRLIGGFVLRHWRAYVSSALMLVGIAVLGVLIPRKVGAMIDGLAAHSLKGNDLLLDIATLLAYGLAIYLLRVGWRLRLYAASYQLGLELRRQFYARLSAQGPQFYQKQRTGDLMALATNDIDAIEMASGEAMLAGFDGIVTLAAVLGIMLLGVDWRLALVALIPFPFMAFAFWRISTHIHTASTDSLKRFSALNDHVQETVAGVRTLRALGLEARSANQFSELAAHAANASYEAQKWEAGYEPAVGLTLAVASALTLGVGGYLVLHDQLTVGALTSFSMYLGQLIWPMFAAGWVLALVERGRAALARLQPVLDEPLSVSDHGAIEQVPPGPLALEQVSYRYPHQQADALSEVSLQLEPGHTLGVVGPTGSGKSTLLRVLQRQATPHAGQVRWAGAALDEYRLSALRSAVSWVPQESFLFSATIAENIALARPDATRAQVEHAADMADIHNDILRFPQGYETPVGERGITLSGGQRQRVAIARALLAESSLLLLDDALSAVDTGTEARILAHLADLRRERPERSAVIASHRLSAVADADQIVVLHHGRITERGTHEQLLEQAGWYASQWRYQQLEASLDES